MKNKNRRMICWICGRNAKEVEEAIYGGVEEAIKWRDKMDLDNAGEEGDVLQYVETEFSYLPAIALCVICQSILLYQGALAAHMVINDKVIEGELMPYTEYEIIEKKHD